MRSPLIALAAMAPLVALGQARPDHDPEKASLGAASYRTYCASCHGQTARGDGPMADRLRYAPADLTRIAQRNGGRFPFDNVARTIDGRKPMKGHGGSEMPIWGDAFKAAGERYDEKAVQRKIDELVHYLASLQTPGR
jgi:mono/diheme cytochrome c family protein